MGRHTVPIGRIFGIPVDLDYTWFLIVALMTWMFAATYYPAEFPGWPALTYWILGVTTALLLFASVLLHELGHSVVALRYEIPVSRITLFIFGGVAQIASEPPRASAEFFIAIAGPVVSFALSAVFAILGGLLQGFGPAFALAKYLAYINGMLGAFNLIPGFPLDGGRVFRAIVWAVTRNMRKATLVAASVGRFFAFVFILVGVWQLFVGNVGTGLWIAFIGWFLESAASAQVQRQLIQGLLTGHRVAEIMSRNYAEIPAGATLQQLVDGHIMVTGRRSFLVRSGDSVVGLLTLHRVKEIPRADWQSTTVAQVMIPLSDVKRLSPDAELWPSLEWMDRDGVNQLPVMSDGRIEGMLCRDDVITFLRTLRELGAPSSRSS